MADEYVPEEERRVESDSDAETISSTSTTDYDRDEAEDLLSKISQCHTTLVVHYNKMNDIVPYMTKTQLASYLGKIHIMPLVKAEGDTVRKIHMPEPSDRDTKIVVQGDTHEERLQYLVEVNAPHNIMLAVAIGDVHINGLSHAQAAAKYGFSKSRIQRAISGKAEHRKGGKQYSQKRRASDDPSSPVEKRSKEEDMPQPAMFPSTSQVQDTLPDVIGGEDRRRGGRFSFHGLLNCELNVNRTNQSTNQSYNCG